MSDNKEARYRTQRNEALKKVKVLEILLEQSGVDSTKIQLAQHVFHDTEIKVQDGQVQSFDAKDSDKALTKQILGIKSDPPKKEEEQKKQEQKEEKQDPAQVIASAIAAALKEAGIGGGEQGKPPKTPGGTQPPGGGTGGSQFTKESIASMDQATFEKNWDAISEAMSSGQITQ